MKAFAKLTFRIGVLAAGMENYVLILSATFFGGNRVVANVNLDHSLVRYRAT